ncbi:MAG: isopentenyl-diphosphate delta-isomerase [Oligoflexia bacterium]|nr:isopentenyl-diphosphate delta-isomerase [Oligoflexia bacterium]
MKVNDRKIDHIRLAEKSRISAENQDHRFNYEPFLSAHPINLQSNCSIKFAGYDLLAPIWISSMVGGSSGSREINYRLAKAANRFSIGLATGSCRRLLECKDKKKKKEYLKDFDLRDVLGKHLPFYINLGIAQIEQLLKENRSSMICDLMDELRVSGLIIHVNPLQEWLQREGDLFTRPPIDTIKEFLEKFLSVSTTTTNKKSYSYVDCDQVTKCNIIIKEVGQGIGPKSIEEILKLPIRALEFSAFGGTNFSKLEILRGKNHTFNKQMSALVGVGHSAEEMVEMVRESIANLKEKALCKEFIISGGIKNFLDGHYLMNKLGYTSIYGYGFNLLELARVSYDKLHLFIENEINGLQMAKNFLAVKF